MMAFQHAIVLSLILTSSQVAPPPPEYVALKVKARATNDDRTVYTLTLDSGAWAKIRAVDIDWPRTNAYTNVVVVLAKTIVVAPDKQSETLFFPLGPSAPVWMRDVDMDVMRSGFAAYRAVTQQSAPATMDDSGIGPKCAADWPDDFKMRAYCQDTQRAAITAMSARSMTTADERTIRAKCSKDWQDDYKMRDYCEVEQLKALARIK